ncbi:histidine utilization repressor [Paraburkholderia phenazinium]|jgi:GntR family histidine utilization transcriptional repressor|uniref:Histidine utilization repressor n=1 Tax=Paraburkholderia phenazinium TaxID=60549 RepID=A0A1G8G7I5_9BURK|nr:histidine utilization repressor [Paraburkholderia phenazinium]SDH90349.1 transcriptional regulator, histidine utilization repressor, GntR family [Paraburkholderia phenazinium]
MSTRAARGMARRPATRGAEAHDASRAVASGTTRETASTALSALDIPDHPTARYEQVKSYIRRTIESGARQPGDRIPSELDLVAELGVSRMTVNRALRELADEGLVTRVSGVGTFVAEAKPQSTLLMIAHIGDEIRSRGHEYSYETLLKQRETAPVVVSNALGLAPGASVFHVICVHRENGLPVQLEDRYVNPATAPEFLQQDFAAIRPSEYLYNVVPAHDVEHVVDAGLPTLAEAELLEIRAEDPCLTLVRRTWTSGVAVTFARFVHPGSRYRLGCRFSPDMSQRQG